MLSQSQRYSTMIVTYDWQFFIYFQKISCFICDVKIVFRYLFSKLIPIYRPAKMNLIKG
jgi:hypothetical protein